MDRICANPSKERNPALMNRSHAPEKVMVIGSGSCARMTANLLARAGIRTILAGDRAPTLDPPPVLAPAVEELSGVRLSACRGFAGNFAVVLAGNSGTEHHNVRAIAVAAELRREAAYRDYGLTPSPVVVPLSKFMQRLAVGETFAGRTIVFVNGLVRENTPPIFEEVVRAALNLQPATDTRCYVLTGNLKVAGQGLEALYREAKAAGVLFFKFDQSAVRFRQNGATVSVEFEDAPSGQRLHLEPDLLVVDEFLRPAESLADLAQTLDVQTDAGGFLQVENVHRFPVFTNRRGILAVGPARGPLLPSEMAADAAAAAATLLAPLEPDVRFRAEIDRGLCIRCLTCFRLCPYRAIAIGGSTRIRVEVAPEACEGCGICAAECPRRAITMTPVAATAEPIDARLASAGPPVDLLVFCCTRSAARAAELARELGHRRADGVHCLEVPCTGMISLQHLLAAFSSGAHQVLVLACHPGNCHSETGNERARMRVAQLKEQLATMGIAAERLQFHTLAANMATEFTELVHRTSGA